MAILVTLVTRARIALKLIYQRLFKMLQHAPVSVEIPSRVLFLQMYSNKKPHALGSAYGVTDPHRQKAAHRHVHLAQLLIRKVTLMEQDLKPESRTMRNLVLGQLPNLLGNPQMV